MKRSFLRRLLRILSSLFLLLVCAGLWLTGTSAGLQALLRLGAQATGSEISVSALNGSLLDGAELRSLVVRHGAGDVRVDEATLRCDCALLLAGIVRLPELTLRRVNVRPAPGGSTRPSAAPVLPFPVGIEKLRIRDLNLHGAPLLTQLEAGLEAGANGIEIHDLKLAARGHRLRYQGALKLDRRWRASGEASWDAIIADYFPAYGRLRLDGTPAQLNVSLHMESPLPGDVRVTARDLFALPRWEGELRTKPSSLRLIDPAIPASFSAWTELAAAGSGWDWQLNGKIALRETRAADDPVPEQSVEIPVSARGSGTPPILHVEARWQDAAWQAGGLGLSGITGRIEADNASGNWQFVLDSAVFADGAQPGRIAATGEFRDGALRISDAMLDMEGAGVNAHGTVRRDDAGARFDLEAAWRRIAWRLTEGLPLELHDGNARLEGQSKNWIITLDTGVAGDGIPPGEIELAGRGSGTLLNIEALDVRTAAGLLQATGQAAWRGGPELEVTFHGEAIDPGRNWRGWTGNVNLRGEAAWRGNRRTVRGDLNGQLRGFPVSVGLDATWQPGDLQIREATFSSGSATGWVQGRAGTTLDLAWRVHAPDLSTVHPSAAGSLSGAGRISGGLPAPALVGEFRGAGIVMPWLSVAMLEVQADLDADSGRTRMDGSMTDLEAFGLRVDRTMFALHGTQDAYAFTLEAAGHGASLGLRGNGAASDHAWNGEILELRVDSPALGSWSLDRPWSINPEDGTGSHTACLRREAARICPELRFAGKEWSFAAEADRLGLTLLETWMPDALRAHGTWSGHLTMNGRSLELLAASAELAARDAQLELATGETEPHRLALRTGTGVFELRDGRLHTRTRLEFSDPGMRPLVADLTFDPVDRWPPDPGRVGVRGTVTGGIENIGFLAAANQRLSELSGTLSLDVDVGGTLAAPVPSGSFALTDGGFRLPDLGTEVRGLAIEGSADNDDNMVLAGRMQSGSGQLDLGGRITSLRNGLSANVQITGERFEAANLPEVWALVSPQLHVEVAGAGATIKGQLHVPEARIDLDEATPGATLSDDVIVVGEETHAGETRAGRADADVEIVLGENVQVEGQGLKGRLAGRLRIQAPAGRKPLADGELQIVGGVFSAYGQTLSIDEGRIIFRRAELDNPELSVRATRTSGDVVAGVSVTGFLTDPRIALFSSPSMSQEQILSHVIFGRPLSGLNTDDGNELVTAAASLGLQNSSFLTNSLSSTFGLDQVSVETDAAAQSASLIVGKYLSPRLYLAYGLGVYQALNTVRLRYDISDDWAVQAERSEELGFDVFYKISR